MHFDGNVKLIINIGSISISDNQVIDLQPGGYLNGTNVITLLLSAISCGKSLKTD